MRKKTIAKRPPREKVYKLPTKLSTRSQDRTFTPSPSPLTSPPRTAPIARTKTTPRYHAPAKPTSPPKATPSKPSSSKPSSSKGKRSAVEEPVPETTKPKSRSVPMRSQRGNSHRPLKSVREPDIDPFAHKSHFMTSHSDYNPHHFKSAMNHDFYEGVIQYRTLCPSFLVNLPDLKKKGFPFVENLEFLDWNHLFEIKKPVYPQLVKEFYANMTYHEGSVHSYVKGRDIILNNETISDSLKYTDVGPCAYTSVKWDDGVGISYHDALAHICEHVFLIDGITPTHKGLGYERAQLHRIVNHILIPQSGSYQRVSYTDTLILYALITKIEISFAYFMARYMFDSVRSVKDKALPYSMFLTCIFEHFGVDLSNEDYENRHSYLKGGSSVKQNKGPTRSERVVLDDEDDDFVPEDSPSLSTEGISISTGKKSALLNVVKDVVQEFVSQSNHLIAMNKEQRKLASKHENFLKKSRDRVAVFMTFIDNLQKDEDPATDVEEEADSKGNGSDD
ncbi:uncharacterized protein [Arachis hypogaea]|uniref:uncharacterized protein n=1 Tax=Arachis hypogaea TaxID=3818 RepID=UPI003B2246DF|nr:uncharacterized protein DS421_17g595960 [Arachis hypogaea]